MESDKKTDKVIEDLNIILNFIDENYKDKMECIQPDWPEDLIFIKMNSFFCFLIGYLYDFLDIENRIKLLKDKNLSSKEDMIKINKIENTFNKIKKESIEVKEFSQNLLISFKDNFEKIKDKHDSKKIYENLCLGVIDNAISYYDKFKKLIIIIDDEIKLFKE